MTSTLTSYALIARDLPSALKRKGSEAEIARDTAYYKANIGAVKSVDDLLADRRLYTYAMKAYGLEDMTYAKAFMRKVLSEGTADPTSFANRLADERYVAIAEAFDFTRAYGVFGAGQNGVKTETEVSLPTEATITAETAVPVRLDFSGTNAARLTITTQVASNTTETGTIVLDRRSLIGWAENLAAVTPTELVAAVNAQIETSGKDNLAGKVVASLDDRNRIVVTTTPYNDLGLDGEAGGSGPNADVFYPGSGAVRTVRVEAASLGDSGQTSLDIGFGLESGQDAQTRAVVEAYVQQSLEEDAGAEDTGVRLALYFTRKAAGISSAYDILGDPALSQVANTLIGLSASSGAATSQALDRRAQSIASKIDLASLKDPEAVQVLARRFAAIWDAQNNTATAPILALFANSGSAGGITPDMLINLQSARFRS